MRAVGLDTTKQGYVSDFRGVKIKRGPDGSFKLMQPHLIDQILKDLRLNADNAVTKPTPAKSSVILTHNSRGPPIQQAI
jgi:hypothetical protein